MFKKLIVGAPRRPTSSPATASATPKRRRRSDYTGIGDAMRNDNFAVDSSSRWRRPARSRGRDMLDHRRAQADLPRPRSTLLRGSWKGGKLLLELDPPDRGTGPQPDESDCARARMRHRRRRQHGARRQRRRPPDRQGPSVPIGVPQPHPITRDFQPRHARAEIARPSRPSKAAPTAKFAQKVIQTNERSWAGSRHQERLRRAGRRSSRTSTRATSRGRSAAHCAAVSAPAGTALPPTAGCATRRNPRRAWSSSATATSPPTGWSSIQGNRDLFLNMAELAGPAGRPDRDPSEGSSDRPLEMTADHYKMTVWAALADHSGAVARQRRPGVVAQALVSRES